MILDFSTYTMRNLSASQSLRLYHNPQSNPGVIIPYTTLFRSLSQTMGCDEARLCTQESLPMNGKIYGKAKRWISLHWAQQSQDRMYGKSWSDGLGVGPSDPWIRLWVTVNPKRLGGTQIPHDVGEELRQHPCLFGSFLVGYEFHIHAWNMAWG